MEGPGEGEVFLGKRCCLLSVLHSGYCKQTLGEQWGRALPTIVSSVWEVEDSFWRGRVLQLGRKEPEFDGKCERRPAW